jgi:hypothetical protein
VNALRKGRVGVTQHALIRFLERVKGVDLEEAINEMVPDTLESQMEVVGYNGKFPGPPGFQIVVKDGVVITVIPS